MAHNTGTYWRDMWNIATREQSYLNSFSNEWVTTWSTQEYDYLKECKVAMPNKSVEIDPAELLDFLSD